MTKPRKKSVRPVEAPALAEPRAMDPKKSGDQERARFLLGGTVGRRPPLAGPTWAQEGAGGPFLSFMFVKKLRKLAANGLDADDLRDLVYLVEPETIARWIEYAEKRWLDQIVGRFVPFTDEEIRRLATLADARGVDPAQMVRAIVAEAIKAKA